MPREDRLYATERRWQLTTIPNLVGGLNTTDAQDLIDEQQTPDSENYTFRDGRLRVDTGYKKLGGSVLGTVRAGFQHETATGTVEFVLVTDVTFYRYVPATNQWHFVPGAALASPGHTQLDGAHAGGVSTLAVDSSTGFVAGGTQNVAVELADGSQYRGVVNTVPNATSITIIPALPSAANDNAPVFKAVALTGSPDFQVVILGIPATEWTVFTNGVNTPKRYDGSTCIDIPGLGNVICRTMALYKNHLMLGNLIDAGTAEPGRVRWCRDGNFSDWSGGDASFNNLADTRDPISAMAPLADDLIIYRTRGAVHVQHLALPLTPFAFRQLIFGESVGGKGIGAVSPNAVFPLHDMHFFISIDGVYVYQGGVRVQEVSAPLRAGVFGVGGLSRPDLFHRSFLHYADGSDELFVFVPCVTGETYPRHVFSLDLPRGVWRQRRFAHQMACIATRVGGETVRIIDLVGTIAEQAWTLGAGFSSARQPNLVIGGPDQQPWLYDYIHPTDDGVQIQAYIKTKVFRVVDRTMRFHFFQFDHKGPAFEFTLAVDGTVTFIGGGTLPASGTMRQTRCHKEVTTESVQLQIRSTGAGAEIGQVAMKSKESGRWHGASAASNQ